MTTETTAYVHVLRERLVRQSIGHENRMHAALAAGDTDTSVGHTMACGYAYGLAAALGEVAKVDVELADRIANTVEFALEYGDDGDLNRDITHWCSFELDHGRDVLVDGVVVADETRCMRAANYASLTVPGAWRCMDHRERPLEQVATEDHDLHEARG